MKTPFSIQILILPLLLSACAAPLGPRDNRTVSLIDRVIEESIETNQAAIDSDAPSVQVQNALLPAIELDLPGGTGIDTEPRFDIKVNRASAREFFVGLVDGTPYNIVVHPKVHGKISLDLKNVTVNEVLEIVRNIYSYDYERTDAAYYVYPNEIRTKIFKVNYIDVQRRGTTTMRVSSGQASGNSSSSSSTDGESSVDRNTVDASSIDTSSESNFWRDTKNAVLAIVGSGKGRSVVVSSQSGVIVITAMPDELRAVEDYLHASGNIMARQVIIEAKIIEVTLSDSFQSGVNWSALKNSGSSSVVLGQTGGGSIFDNGASVLDGNTGNLNPTSLSQVNNTSTSSFGGMFSAALNIKSNFAAFIELLKTQGDVQVLSSPQVSTMNNQKAVIKVGTDEFFVTDIETNTNTASGTSNTQNNVELTPFFSGVSLDVIPQISDDGYIIMHIHPTVVSVTEKIKNISVSGTTTLSIPLAVRSIRETDTIIKARSGQVVVIGGLMQSKTLDEDSSVPVLGDIPIVGGLFQHTKQTTRKSELIILLKPTIVENSKQWNQQLHRVRQNIDHVQGGRPESSVSTEK